MFSPWEYNVDKAAERLLAAAGWNSPAPDAAIRPAANLLAQYLEPLADAHGAQGPHPHQQHGDQRSAASASTR